MAYKCAPSQRCSFLQNFSKRRAGDFCGRLVQADDRCIIPIPAGQISSKLSFPAALTTYCILDGPIAAARCPG
jgi:hypothetical protein